MANITDHVAGHAMGGILGPLGTVVGAAADITFPINMPQPGELIALMNAGRITRFALNAVLRYHGIYSGPPPEGKQGTPIALSDAQLATYARWWDRVIDLSTSVPTEEDANILLNRNAISPPEWVDIMSRHGYAKDFQLAWWDNLRKEVPGTSDLVRFAVRHVFEPDLLQHFGYGAEYQPIAEQWYAAQGLVYPVNPDPWAGYNLGSFNWAKAHWVSHWILPSPGQGYEMLQRLRRTLKPPHGPRDPSEKYSTITIYCYCLGQMTTHRSGVLNLPPYRIGQLACVCYVSCTPRDKPMKSN